MAGKGFKVGTGTFGVKIVDKWVEGWAEVVSRGGKGIAAEGVEGKGVGAGTERFSGGGKGIAGEEVGVGIEGFSEGGKGIAGKEVGAGTEEFGRGGKGIATKGVEVKAEVFGGGGKGIAGKGVGASEDPAEEAGVSRCWAGGSWRGTQGKAG